jgi:hypothetical protein
MIGFSTPSLQMNHAVPFERFDLLSPTTRPPSLDLGIRIIVKLDVVLRPVGPLVRNAIWDGPALKFSSHRGRVDRGRRVDGRSSGSSGMVLASLSHGVTFFAQVSTLISEIVERPPVPLCHVKSPPCNMN